LEANYEKEEYMQRIFDDIIILELQKEEWKKEVAKSPIIKPGTVQEREEGALQEKIPWHFYRVTALGEGCTGKVKIGDRILPKPPTPSNPPILPFICWENGERIIKFMIHEHCIAGVE
jgi:hypothetical protein